MNQRPQFKGWRPGLLGALLVFVCLTASAQAATPVPHINLTNAQLRKFGIDPMRMQLGVVSRDGNTLVCYEKEQKVEEIAEGKVFWLHIFHIDWKTGQVTVKSLVAPGITRLENIEMTPDQHWLVVMGDFGARFCSVDLTNDTTHVLLEDRADQPGYRSIPSIFWLDGQKRICTLGYFFDKQGFSQGDSVVSINPQGQGLTAFTREADVTKLLNAIVHYRTAFWFSTNQAYFGIYRPDRQVHLFLYDGTDTLKHIDHGMSIDSIAPGRDRVVYAVTDPDGNRRVMLHDDATGKTKQINPRSMQNLRYLYMSRDGSVLLASDLGFASHQMTTWYAREESDWNLQVVPGIDKTAPGTIRFSPGGEVLAFFNRKGLHLIRLPQD